MPNPDYLHSIGLTEGGMVTLTSLGITNPEPDFTNELDEIVTLSKEVIANGSQTETWYCTFMKMDKRDILRTYCTGKSNYVYIKTLDNEEVYQTYYCLMVWPTREKQVVGRVLDFSIKFLFLVEQ